MLALSGVELSLLVNESSACHYTFIFGMTIVIMIYQWLTALGLIYTYIQYGNILYLNNQYGDSSYLNNQLVP
jgi:hypothetical protein